MSTPPLSLLGRKKARRQNHFWVITCYFNPCRYENRYQNYFKFAQRLRDQQVNLLTVELVTSPDAAHLSRDHCDRYVQIVQPDILWAKECLLNVALANLPGSSTQVCWCDCDILFENPLWAIKCSDALRSFKVVQPYGTSYFLGPHETMKAHGMFRSSASMASYYVNSHKATFVNSPNMFKGHPGYVWAARKEVLTRMGGFYDKCILGHADIVMGLAFCHQTSRDGALSDTWSHWKPGWSQALLSDARQWQRHTSALVDGNVGYVPMNIFHLWHGPRNNRNYEKRGALIADFDPNTHLSRLSTEHVWKWSEKAHTVGLPERCKMYFKSRKEDDVKYR